MNRWISVVIGLVVIALGVWWYTNKNSASESMQSVTAFVMQGGDAIAPGYTEHKFSCGEGTQLSLVGKDDDSSIIGVAFMAKDGTNIQETIPRVEAASGVKYEGFGATVWDKGHELAFSYAGTDYMCAPVSSPAMSADEHSEAR